MGCSPSHGGIIHSIAKNAANPLKRNKAILPPSQDNSGFAIPLLGRNSSCYDPDGESNAGIVRQKDHLQEKDQKPYHQDRSVSNIHNGPNKNVSLPEDHRKEETPTNLDKAMASLSSQKFTTERIPVRKHSSTGSEQEPGCGLQQESNPRKGKKSKSQRILKQGRRAKAREKQIAFCETEKKVDFPELLVKAHQNAYAYLNPNLSKYEAIIFMTNQATQTQLFMQQMISFMALRFDEINQRLEEIADDGEIFLKEVGDNLAWPLGKGDPTEQPDLLQQLLQYTVNKMQTLNGTVASLTSNALQETCSYLQSAATNLQEKLKVKELFDERLLRTITLLEAASVGSPQSHPNDRTLYSEDSGIGGDNESIKECRSPDKLGRQRSCDSSGQISLGGNQEIASQREQIAKTMTGDLAAEMNCKDVFDPRTNKKENMKCSSTAQSGNSTVPRHSSLADSLSMNSLDSSTTLEQDSINDLGSTDSTASDDSYDEGEDNRSLSVTLPQRPLTSPAGTSAYKHSSKWLENPENELMTLKIKEAISEKIKFVPGKSSNNVWTREEGAKSDLRRPSTATGSNRGSSTHRRSRSAESLRSQSEDPTLLELQRTQKELSKKLDKLYMCNGNKNKETQQNTNVKSFVHKKDSHSLNSSTNKLKACLDKSFHILPSQDRRYDHNIASDLKHNKSIALGTTLSTPNVKREEKWTLAERKLESVNVSPRQSVRKLIETFSPLEDSINHTNVKSLGPLRCIRKFGVPVLPPTMLAFRGLEPLNHKHHILPIGDGNTANINTFPSKLITTLPSAVSPDMTTIYTNEEGTEDFEYLPPPPMEILMDDSFNLLRSDEHERRTEATSPEQSLLSARSESCTMRKTATSQKIKASLNAIDLLPSKNSTGGYMSVDTSFRKQEQPSTLRKYSLESDHQLASCRERERGFEIQRKHEIEQAAHLYKQSHKIIPLQNPSEVTKSSNDGEIKEPCIDVLSLLKQKQGSSPSQRRNEKFPAAIRRISPTRVTAPSPPSEKRLTSPPANRAMIQTHSRVQTSPPPLQKKASSTGNPKVPSPPAQRKLPSPPSQRKLPSPPQIRRQPSPPSQRRLPSPPSSRREPSPPLHCTSSPPVSPSFPHKGLRRSSNEQQPSSKMIGNAQSIFCPSSSSLFEAKSPSPPGTSSTEVVSSQVTAPVLRNSFSSRQYGDQQRRFAMSAANPQPFVRRCFSDRRPRVQLRLPVSTSDSATSDPALQPAGAEESARKDSEHWNSQCLAELKVTSQAASHPELCVVGLGFQKD
ncbi:photoreceptor cilium actin regulator [Ascaphus truei]|uniref:photoreceptor cilium actin regulator n=1 Tax=Ascaphus truei TaxID=8439 RepID=UPI003F5909A8